MLLSLGIGLGVNQQSGGGIAPPSTPTGLTVTASGNGTVATSWNSVSGATSYDVQRSPDNSTWTTISSAQAGTTYTDSSTSGTGFLGLWYYRVRATNAIGSSAYSSSVNASPFVAYDQFIDTNGTLLTAHTMNIGSGWSLFGGTNVLVIENGTATVSSNTGCNDITNAGQSAVTVSCTVSDSTSGSLGTHPIVIVGASISNGSLYYLIIGGGLNSVTLYQYNGSGYTMLGSSSVNTTGSHTYKLSRSGNTITAYVDGTSEIVYGSATMNPTSTLVGFGVSLTANALSNFQVTSP